MTVMVTEEQQEQEEKEEEHLKTSAQAAKPNVQSQPYNTLFISNTSYYVFLAFIRALALEVTETRSRQCHLSLWNLLMTPIEAIASPRFKRAPTLQYQAWSVSRTLNK